MHLQKIRLQFKNNVLQQSLKTPADPSKANHLKCILHYIKNSSDDSIKKLLSPGGGDIEGDYIEDENIDGRGHYIFVKYSDFTKIKKQCRSKQ